jgi:hypothetical protein
LGTATLEVSGSEAARGAADLQAALVAGAAPGDSVSPVEFQRSAGLVVAVIGLVFGGVGTARTIWDWWQSRRAQGTTVRILLADGTEVDLSTVSQGELEVRLQRSASQS